MKQNKFNYKILLLFLAIVFIGFLIFISYLLYSFIQQNEEQKLLDLNQSCVASSVEVREFAEDLEESINQGFSGMEGNKNITVYVKDIFYTREDNTCYFTLEISYKKVVDGKLEEEFVYSVYKMGTTKPVFNGTEVQYRIIYGGD